MTISRQPELIDTLTDFAETHGFNNPEEAANAAIAAFEEREVTRSIEISDSQIEAGRFLTVDDAVSQGKSRLQQKL